MSNILKYKDKIVSIGLLPIIITLIGLHFFPNTEMLGFGFGMSVLMLLYNLFKLKDINFFLLLGTFGIGICFFLRLFFGYKYVPLNTITPTLEFIMLSYAFLYVSAPEMYSEILDMLKIRSRTSYSLEAKIIVIISSIHLISLGYIRYLYPVWTPEWKFFLINIIPVSIYIICFIINVLGIRAAAKVELFNNNTIRIAPVCKGKIYLNKSIGNILNKDIKVWDLPMIRNLEGSIGKCEKYAEKITRKHTDASESPRLIMHYREDNGNGTINNVLLFILPLNSETEIKKTNSGHFFTFEELEKNPESYDMNLMKELEHIKMAAEVWNEFL